MHYSAIENSYRKLFWHHVSIKRFPIFFIIKITHKILQYSFTFRKYEPGSATKIVFTLIYYVPSHPFRMKKSIDPHELLTAQIFDIIHATIPSKQHKFKSLLKSCIHDMLSLVFGLKISELKIYSQFNSYPVTFCRHLPRSSIHFNT